MADKPASGGWKAEVKSLAGMVLAILFVWTFVARPFYIPSESMMPTLIKGDRLVVTKYPYGYDYASLIYHPSPFGGRLFGKMPRQGDIVTLDRAGDDLIKRVIALPGDRIEVRHGIIILNGKPVPRVRETPAMIPIDANVPCATPVEQGFQTTGPDGKGYCALPRYRETLPDGATYDTIDAGYFPGGPDDYPETLIPPGYIFVMGDNRDESADSRVPFDDNGLNGPIPLETISGRAEAITHSYDGNGKLWNPVSWITALRHHRAFISLHPSQAGH